MAFANYSGYVKQSLQPQQHKIPKWLMPFNIALIGMDFLVGLIPGMQAPAVQFLLAEGTSGAIFGASYAATGSKGTWWSNLLSFGGAFLGSGAQLFSNSRFLKALDRQDIGVLEGKTNVLKDRITSSIYGIDKKNRFKRYTTKITAKVSPEEIYSEATYKFLYKQSKKNDPMAAWDTQTKTIFSNINKKKFFNSLKDIQQDRLTSILDSKLENWIGKKAIHNKSLFEMNLIDENKLALTPVNFNATLPGTLSNIETFKYPFKINWAALEQTEGIVDGFRRLGISDTINGVLISALRQSVSSVTDREEALANFMTALSLDDSMFSQEFSKLLAKIRGEFKNANKILSNQAIIYRAWTDAMLTSPSKFLSRYGYKNPFLDVSKEIRPSTIRRMLNSLSTSHTLDKVFKGVKMLNPGEVARMIPNIFFRKMVRIFNKFLKGVRKQVSQEKSIVDKGILAMEKGVAAAAKLYLKGEEALERVKRGEIINLDSAWLESIQFIEGRPEESLYVINFQPDTTNAKPQVLCWMSDKLFFEILEYPGNTYLDNFALSRGGKAIRLGAILGWGLGIGEAIPLGKMTLSVGVIRKLLSIASNLKKSIDGNYINKWENPHKHLFENFYLYSISRSSRFVSRNLFGTMLNRAIAGRLGNKLNTELQHTFKHMIPMELQRISTSFVAQTSRNALQGKKIFNKNVLGINTAKFFRDQSRYLLHAYNPNLGTLRTLQINRKLALFGRASKIGGYNLNKRYTIPKKK